MHVDRKQLKIEARQAIAAAKPAPFWVMLAMYGISCVLSILSMSLDGTLNAARTMYAAALRGEMVYAEPQALGGIVGWLLTMAVQIMIWELAVGLSLYTLRVWRREKAGCGDLFDSFGVFFRSIWIQILPAFFIGLWGLIYVLPVSTFIMLTGNAWWVLIGAPLLAPTVMATYAYQQSVYLMLDNPGLSCLQCVRLSREIMRGHKWEAFVLELSFLGWLLLCLIPVAGWILFLWVAAYMRVTNAGFYEKLMVHYMAENAPFPGPETPAG